MTPLRMYMCACADQRGDPAGRGGAGGAERPAPHAAARAGAAQRHAARERRAALRQLLRRRPQDMARQYTTLHSAAIRSI